MFLPSFDIKLYLFLIFLSCSCFLFSQKQPVNFPFTHFEIINAERGLKGNEISAIGQDNNGFMWFVTDDGLHRYDGITFRSWPYKTNDPNTLTPGGTYGLAIDKNGTIWIPSNFKGFFSFDPLTEKFTMYRHDPGNTNSLVSDHVETIGSGNDGSIWLGTDKGLDMYSPSTKKFTHYKHITGNTESIGNNEIQYIVTDKRNDALRSTDIWLINGELGIECFDTKTGKIKNRFNLPFPRPYGGRMYPMELKSSVIWFGSNDSGIYGFDITKMQVIHIESNHPCENGMHIELYYPVMEDHAGNLWTKNDNNEMVYYDTVNRQFHYYKIESGYINFLNTESMIYEDNSCGIWLGTNRGVIYVDTRQKKFYSGQISDHGFRVASRQIQLIHALSKDKLLMAVASDKTYSVDIKTGDAQPFSLPGYGELYNSMDVYDDSKGILWFVGDFGIISYNRMKKKSRRYEANSTHGIVEDDNGKLWVTDEKDGLRLFDPVSGNLQPFSFDSAVFGNMYEQLFKDSHGILYLSSRNGGFTIFNPLTQKFTVYHHDANDSHSVSSERINHGGFVEQKSRRGDGHRFIWFGTTPGGLNVFDPQTGKFRVFTMEDGLPTNFVFQIIEDKNGKYWVSGRDGISCFKPPDDPFDSAFHIVFRNYNSSDGLPTDNCTRKAAFRGEDGTIYFGTLNGFFYFNPDSLNDNEVIPPVYITEYRLRNKLVSLNDSITILKLPIEYTKEIQLNYRQNDISFSFAALNYIHPQKNKYAYKLENYDDDWIYTDASKRFATYTNLDPGEYTFKVKGSNNDGKWNETPTGLKIIITPPFWQTTWFEILVALAVVGIIYAFYRYRIGQIVLLQRIRNKIAADLHDDIGSTLNSISVYSEVAKKDASRKDFALNMIGESSRKIIDSMSDIVWSINPENDGFDKIIFRMRSLTYNLLKAKKIDCSFKADESLNALKLPMQTRRNFYLIFKEVLNNLVKYSQATRASVTLMHENRQALLIVHDDGIGFDISAKYNGNGLNNIRKRADEINAKLNIESSVGEGATIELSLKV